jgi:hypothetical protein
LPDAFLFYFFLCRFLPSVSTAIFPAATAATAVVFSAAAKSTARSSPGDRHDAGSATTATAAPAWKLLLRCQNRHHLLNGEHRIWDLPFLPQSDCHLLRFR